MNLKLRRIRRRTAAWFGGWILGGLWVTTAASADFPDAAALAQGGVWIFERLDLAPGAPVETGAVALDVWRTDPQAGIAVAAVRIVQVKHHQAGAVAWEQLSSPVLRETACRTAWQWHPPGAHARVGVSLQAARREFDRYGAWWRFESRAGAGWFAARGGAGVVLQMPFARGALPQLHAGVCWRAGGHAALALQVDPEPLRPGAWHVAWSWEAPGYRALVGYDAAANAVGVGLDVARGGLHVVWGARMHPELGWSHAWSCVWQR